MTIQNSFYSNPLQEYCSYNITDWLNKWLGHLFDQSAGSSYRFKDLKLNFKFTLYSQGFNSYIFSAQYCNYKCRRYKQNVKSGHFAMTKLGISLCKSQHVLHRMWFLQCRTMRIPSFDLYDSETDSSNSLTAKTVFMNNILLLKHVSCACQKVNFIWCCILPSAHGCGTQTTGTIWGEATQCL